MDINQDFIDLIILFLNDQNMFSSRDTLFIVSVLFIFSFVIGCKASKISGNSFSRQDMRISFVDSLLQTGQDSILIYFEECNGCIPGWKGAMHVFWKTDNLNFLKSFQIGEVSDVQMIDFDILSAFRQYQLESTAILVEPDHMRLLHYRYSVVAILLNGKIDSMWEMEDELITPQNANHWLVRFILKIKSIVELPG